MNPSRSAADPPVVIGAGGLAAETIDVLSLDYDRRTLAVFSDIPPPDSDQGTEMDDLLRGTTRELIDQTNEFEFVVAIGDMHARKRLFCQLVNAGGKPRSVVDPSARIGASSSLGAGSIVLAGATITARSSLGRAAVINPGVRISHDCHVGDFVTFGPNAVLCGRSHIGSLCLVGANATVNPRVSVRANTQLGAGAVLTRDIDPAMPPGEIWVGVPAHPAH